MKFPIARLLLIAASTLCAGLAGAEKADRNKPMNVEADALRYDDSKQVSVFTGRVVLTKGSIVIRGARIEVRQDAQGNQFGVVSAESGKLAFFRQKREGLDEFIEGEAQTIEYDSRADTVRFSSQAQLRRLRGAVLNDELTGGVILYNNTTDVFSIDGAPAQDGGAAGRVRAVLAPRPASGSSAPAGAASASALSIEPALRSSSRLGEDKK
jgi:lipopolysaccharide export system protein LptA